MKSGDPLSYGSYWSDSEMLDPLCDALKDLLDDYAEPDLEWPRSASQRPLPVKP